MSAAEVAPGAESSAMMSVPELAARIGIDVSTAYRYLRAGSLPGVQVGATWLIDRARVERFLAGHEDAAGAPLIAPPAVTEVPALTLLPSPESRPSVALAWLRGAHAALGLLLEAAEGKAAIDRRDTERSALTGA